MKFLCLLVFMSMHPSLRSQMLPPDTRYVKLSQVFLYAIRTGENTESYIQQLKMINEAELTKQLITDEDKKAFWLNIYNAFVQKLLTEHPEKYKSRNAFFSNKQIIISATSLSLDNIEHGILRRSKIKWGMGYLNKLFTSGFEKRFRVAKLDYRVHFALNCGAKSCPPIAYYEPGKINSQLNLAAKVYLSAEAVYQQSTGRVYLPKIMSWFRKDFGGKKGIKDLLIQYRVIEENKKIKIRFRKYDWTLFLHNYKSP